MRHILAALALLATIVPASPQQLVVPCWRGGPDPCTQVSAANPLPISGSITVAFTAEGPITPATATATSSLIIGGQYNSTQATFTNLQQGSLQISARGALYIATGADTPVFTGPGTAGTAAAGVLTVQGIAAMTPLLATLSGTNNIATVTAVTSITNAVQTTLPTTPAVASGSGVILSASAAAAAGISPSATQAAASNSVLKAGAGNLYSLTVTIGATTGWVMVFDATALPSNGATGASLKYCYPIISNGTQGGQTFQWQIPVVFATGITVGFSSTTCSSLTASTTAFFYGQAS